jgi:hypothetical protein
MAKKIKPCKCGSTEFIIIEANVWDAILTEEDNEISAFNMEGGVTHILCKKCNKNLTEKYQKVNVNFN